MFLVLIGFTNELVSRPSFYVDETKIIGTSLENNFYTIHDEESDHDLDVYCVDDNDHMIHHLYSFFSEYELRVTSMDRILHNEMEQKLKKILLHPISIDLEEYDNNDNESY